MKVTELIVSTPHNLFIKSVRYGEIIASIATEVNFMLCGLVPFYSTPRFLICQRSINSNEYNLCFD